MFKTRKKVTILGEQGVFTTNVNFDFKFSLKSERCGRLINTDVVAVNIIENNNKVVKVNSNPSILINLSELPIKALFNKDMREEVIETLAKKLSHGKILKRLN